MSPPGGRSSAANSDCRITRLRGNDVLDARLEVPLVDPLRRVGSRLSAPPQARPSARRFGCRRRSPRSARPAHWKSTSAASGVRDGCICTRQICSRSAAPGISNSTCVRMRRSNAGSKFAARFVAKMTTPLYDSSSCSSTLTTVFDSRWKPMIDRVERREAIASASSNSSTALLVARGAEDGGDVLRRLAHPQRFELGIADDQQPPAERVRDRFGADRLAGARRAGEVEREREPGRMPLAEAPAVEDEIVLRHLRQRDVERAARRRRQDHVVERAARRDRLDRAAAANAKQTSERERTARSTVPFRQRTINRVDPPRPGRASAL